ncbi:hypothetical protein KYLE_100 [Pantoea phage Kyle]|uniref:Uncharacterized protein n=1 Tax=Pantoea phage Kyle TaxID=2589665 RepID=A0A514A8P2_9CAUD|nr:hypothetical protein HWC52_gp100 [Pantoea phage Kyle]QDH49648.1 hypothetical protein KYLE_100 [Pantoea phage Kyle]
MNAYQSKLWKKVADFLASGAKYMYMTRKQVEGLTTLNADEILRLKGESKTLDQILKEVVDLRALSDYTAKELRKAKMQASFALEDRDEYVRKETRSLNEALQGLQSLVEHERLATARERKKNEAHLRRIKELESKK